MRYTFLIEKEQPDELVMYLCQVMDAIREAMDIAERRQQINVMAELKTRLQEFADLIDRLPSAD
jgi:hypothetical protein